MRIVGAEPEAFSIAGRDDFRIIVQLLAQIEPTEHNTAIRQLEHDSADCGICLGNGIQHILNLLSFSATVISCAGSIHSI